MMGLHSFKCTRWRLNEICDLAEGLVYSFASEQLVQIKKMSPL